MIKVQHHIKVRLHLNELIDFKLEKTIFNFIKVILEEKKTLFVGKNIKKIYLFSADALSAAGCTTKDWRYDSL